MINLGQPLDVAVNKSFQDSYANSYDKYLAEALKDPIKKTKAGNTKASSHEIVSDWVWKWVESIPEELIKKTFVLCGINIADFEAQIRKGRILSGAEIFAVSSMEALKIVLTEYDDSGEKLCVTTYSIEQAANTTNLIKAGEIYATKLE